LRHFTLDACALIALAYAEPGSEIIAALFKDAAENMARLTVHSVNLAEAYVFIFRKDGAKKADAFLSSILEEASPIQVFSSMDPEIVNIPRSSLGGDTKPAPPAPDPEREHVDMAEFMRSLAAAKTKYMTHFTDAFVMATNDLRSAEGTIVTADRGFERYQEENGGRVLFFR
jgi:predicted nucleic acid-binding protein